MKPGIHPETREILFVDRAANYVLKTRSTMNPTDTYEYEGKEYPCVFMETSSASHPFYTGQKVLLKTSSIDKFYARQKKTQEISK